METMRWVDYALYAVFGGAGAILLALVVNLAITAKRGRPSMLLSRVYYVLAVLVVLLNLARSVVLYSWGVWLAHAIVLACILAAFRRSEREAREEPEA